jgi:hypothetical protein
MIAILDDWWVPVFFGYPALLTSIALSALGIYVRKPVLLIASSLFSLLPSYYLGITPKFRYIGFSLPIFNLLAAYALYKQHIRLAILLQIPLVGCTLWLLVLAISQ